MASASEPQRALPDLDPERYEVISHLGKGGFANVYKVRHRGTNTLMAMKVASIEHEKGNNDAWKELWNMITVTGHPGIVQWHDNFVTNDNRHRCLTMELFETDLGKFMKNNTDWKVKVIIARQVSEAVAHIHAHKPQVIHRDIKPENILIKHCPISRRLMAKVSDFGISNLVELKGIERSLDVEKLTRFFGGILTTARGRGTRPYMAPEFFAAMDGQGLTAGKLKLDASVDIYALGVVFAYIFCYNSGNVYVDSLKMPASRSVGFETYNAMKAAKKMPSLLEPDDDIYQTSQELGDMIVKMTSPNPSDRPSASEVHGLLCRLESKADEENASTKSPQGHEKQTQDQSLVMSAHDDHSTPTAVVLLQALNDRDQAAIDDVLARDDVAHWINKPTLSSGWFQSQLEFTTCLCAATAFSSVSTVQQLVKAGAEADVTDALGWLPIHWACLSNIEAKAKVEFLLHCNPPAVNAETYSNDTPLTLAALKDSPDLISVLVKNEAAVNKRGAYGRTALHNACDIGNIRCVHKLMQQGAEVNVRDRNNKATPLQLAARFGQDDCVKALVKFYGAAINAVDKNGNTALCLAALEGHAEVVKILASNPQCDVNIRGELGRTALHNACNKGHLTCVHELMLHGADVEVTASKTGATALILAAVSGHDACVKALLGDYGALVNAVNTNGNTALHCAARESHTDVVQTLLLHPHCDVTLKNKRDWTAEVYASVAGHEHLLPQFQASPAQAPTLDSSPGDVTKHDAGVNIQYSNTDVTPLQLDATIHINDGAQEPVEDYGAAINAVNKGGDTALCLAALEGHAEVVKILSSNPQCDVNIRGELGRTALHNACEKGHLTCVHELMLHGADVDVTDSALGATALMLAAYFGHDACAKALLKDYGAPVNAVDTHGNTALHCTAYKGHADVVQTLLSHHDCDVTLKNKDGKTAEEKAIAAGHEHLLPLFEAPRPEQAPTLGS